ncbi:MAG: hypothetical protein H0W83_18535, partial [Planctomycetes bacterium]|nr:hypothetical protein [Planctomycetota bacterium]
STVARIMVEDGDPAVRRAAFAALLETSEQRTSEQVEALIATLDDAASREGDTDLHGALVHCRNALRSIAQP